MSAGWGFRWLKVNNYIHVYIGTTIHDGKPFSEPLAYVQMTSEEGIYRSLRPTSHGSEEIPIIRGPLEYMIVKTEAYVMSTGLTKNIQGVNTPGSLIEEGLHSTDPAPC